MISLVDRDPEFAAAAVKAVVTAYSSVFRAQSDEFQQQRIAKLGAEEKQLEAQLADKKQELRGVAGDEAFVDIEKRRDAAAREMEQYRAMLTDFRIALVMAQNKPMNAGAAQPAGAVAAEMAALNDPYLRNLMDQRMKAEENIDRLQLLGYSDQFRDMITAKQQLTMVQEKITKYMAKPRPAQAFQQGGALPVAQTGPLALANRSLEDLRADEAGVKKLYDQANTQMAQLATKAEKSETLRMQIKDLNTDLSEISRRKRLLEMEGGLAAKLSIISYGEVPISPFQDRRMIKAGMGGMAGLFFPAAIFVLLGWINTRFRYSGETEDAIAKRTALLGIVPAVPERMRDPEQAATVAESVHHIRVMLQLQRQNAEGGVYMVTSSSASEGKTSITVALGMSYAASGCKTLIIDCDPVGRALTRGFTAERMSGFREALANGEMQNFVREQTTGLCVLPVGDADASTGWTVSPATVARLLAKAKREFDVILVDTGPILGSVVASVVAPAVDDVIFVVARGAQRPRVERAIRYLDSIGAHVAGCVFNRAKVREYERSISKSMSSPSTRRAKLSTRDAQLKGMQGFGPLVECVTAFVPRANGHSD
jgi:Mrp family chromosome partitioning ATPase